MRLEQFQRERVGALTRFSQTLNDEGGRPCELLIVGDSRQVSKAFGESDFDAVIRPGVTREQWEADLEETLRMRQSIVPANAFDDPSSHFKSSPAAPTAKNSIIFALRRVQPGGTAFTLIVPLIIPVGVSIFFVFPRSFVCGGSVLPVGGDPDLFLTINSFVGPPVSSSTLGGLMPDTVGFAAPPFLQFFPVFRVFGFLASATTFVGSSLGLP